MDGIYKSLREKFEKAIEYCREELLSIRTGKDAPAILETITVLAYGGTTKLRMQELATISITGPGSLLINPFDPATVQDIEKAILALYEPFPLVSFPHMHSLAEEMRECFIGDIGSVIVLVLYTAKLRVP